MTTQPLALQMAKDFDACAGTLPDRFYFEAATELRRLHEVNQELLVALCCVRDMVGHPDNLAFIDAAIAKATGETK